MQHVCSHDFSGDDSFNLPNNPEVRYHYYPILQRKKLRHQQFRNLPKFTQRVCGGSGPWTGAVQLLSLCTLTFILQCFSQSQGETQRRKTKNATEPELRPFLHLKEQQHQQQQQQQQTLNLVLYECLQCFRQSCPGFPHIRHVTYILLRAIIPNLQMRKLRLREVKYFSQGHMSLILGQSRIQPICGKFQTWRLSVSPMAWY